MEMQTYNNYFFSSIALFSVLKHGEKWKLSEVVLILPIITQAKIIGSLNRRKRELSILDMVVDKSENFHNFNKMFNSYKVSTINCLALLIEMGLIDFDKETQEIEIRKDYPIENVTRIIQKNKRLKTIDKTSEKVYRMLKEKTGISELYIQLGVIV